MSKPTLQALIEEAEQIDRDTPRMRAHGTAIFVEDGDNYKDEYLTLCGPGGMVTEGGFTRALLARHARSIPRLKTLLPQLAAELRRTQEKLERTKGHMRRRLTEEESTNQKIYDELIEENARLKEALVFVRAANPNPDLSVHKYRTAWELMEAKVRDALGEKP